MWCNLNRPYLRYVRARIATKLLVWAFLDDKWMAQAQRSKPNKKPKLSASPLAAHLSTGRVIWTITCPPWPDPEQNEQTVTEADYDAMAAHVASLMSGEEMPILYLGHANPRAYQMQPVLTESGIDFLAVKEDDDPADDNSGFDGGENDTIENIPPLNS